MKFSSWLQQNNFLLHILVTRYLGQWGFECQLIKKRDKLEGKDIFLSQVTGELIKNDESVESYPNKKIFGFGVDKYSSIEGLVKKVAAKSLCYLDEGRGYVLVEVPADISYGNQEEYTSLMKGEGAAK